MANKESLMEVLLSDGQPLAHMGGCRPYSERAGVGPPRCEGSMYLGFLFVVSFVAHLLYVTRKFSSGNST